MLALDKSEIANLVTKAQRLEMHQINIYDLYFSDIFLHIEEDRVQTSLFLCAMDSKWYKCTIWAGLIKMIRELDYELLINYSHKHNNENDFSGFLNFIDMLFGPKYADSYRKQVVGDYL